jgi:hypothetical protein
MNMARAPALRGLSVHSAALAVGVVALLVSSVGALSEPQQFLRSYLVGYLYWVSLAVGSLAVLMIHHLVGGRWGYAIQRILEAATRTLPVMLILFLPLAAGLKQLYVWAVPGAGADHLIGHKAAYLNPAAFLVRTAIFFAVWITLAMLLSRAAAKLDDSTDSRWRRQLRRLSGPGLVAYVLTASLAAFDWGMSLDPRWYSTIYGLLFIVGQGLAVFAFAIVMLYRVSDRAEMQSIAVPERFHDLGNLMMAFVMLWAYISFSQLLIIWSGNLPEEVHWYLHRLGSGWQFLALALLLLHFAVPFAILLSRRVKRRARLVAAVALAILVMRFVDIYWIIVPAFHTDELYLHWLDLTVPIGIGGLWVASFFRELGRRSLVVAAGAPTEDGRSHG